MARPLRILIVSTELDPIANTGELGRSVGGLAKALKGLRVDVRVVMPVLINTNLFNMVRLVEKVRIQTFTRFGDMSIWRDEIPGEVPVYLLERRNILTAIIFMVNLARPIRIMRNDSVF